MILVGLSFGFGLVSFGYGAVGVPPGPARPLAAESLAIAQLFFVPVPAPAIAFLLLVFPADRMLTPRWRIVGIAAVVGGVLYAVGILFSLGAIDRDMFPAIDNPFSAPSAWSGLLDLMTFAGNAIVTGAILLGALSLGVRYRRADAVESAQIRWIALVAGSAAVVLAVAAMQIDEGPLADVSEVAFGVGLVVLAGTPIAIGIAITRYHLYDIDRLINRTLVYGSLTAILAGIFTAAVGLAQRVFVATTGQSSDAAIVLTTLIVATLYAPLRKRLEAIVDRRFKYDEHRFGAYRSEIKQVLSVLDPTRAAERLATEAVAELAATGGAVVDSANRPTATAGVWPGPPTVRLPIPDGGPAMAALVVGPRLDGRPYDPRSIAELEDIVSLAAAAVRYGPSPSDSGSSAED
jgi:hypothetical protein